MLSQRCGAAEMRKGESCRPIFDPLSGSFLLDIYRIMLFGDRVIEGLTSNKKGSTALYS